MAIQTYNISETDIWKRVDNIGSTTYVNITDGTTQRVPWGAIDYVNIITGNVLSIAITVGLVWLGFHYLLK